MKLRTFVDGGEGGGSHDWIGLLGVLVLEAARSGDGEHRAGRTTALSGGEAHKGGSNGNLEHHVDCCYCCLNCEFCSNDQTLEIGSWLET